MKPSNKFFINFELGLDCQEIDKSEIIIEEKIINISHENCFAFLTQDIYQI